jgi:hypothetical protein
MALFGKHEDATVLGGNHQLARYSLPVLLALFGLRQLGDIVADVAECVQFTTTGKWDLIIERAEPTFVGHRAVQGVLVLTSSARHQAIRRGRNATPARQAALGLLLVRKNFAS